MTGFPSTLYGVYKRANEGTAQVYLAEDGVSSIGLRPHTVFGPGRDQGLTSQPTLAMLAAARGREFRIGYGGRASLQYAPDVAHAFVEAALADYRGASVYNVPGPAIAMDEVVAAIERAVPESAGSITFDADTVLSFPEEADAASLVALLGLEESVSFEENVADAIDRFRVLNARGLLPDRPAA
jgi:UDP-glucuronate 4-epimerase